MTRVRRPNSRVGDDMGRRPKPVRFGVPLRLSTNGPSSTGDGTRCRRRGSAPSAVRWILAAGAAPPPHRSPAGEPGRRGTTLRRPPELGCRGDAVPGGVGAPVGGGQEAGSSTCRLPAAEDGRGREREREWRRRGRGCSRESRGEWMRVRLGSGLWAFVGFSSMLG